MSLEYADSLPLEVARESPRQIQYLKAKKHSLDVPEVLSYRLDAECVRVPDRVPKPNRPLYSTSELD